MGIIVNDQGGRSQLQEKLAAELKEKLAKSGNDEGDKVVEHIKKSPDLVDESEYVKDFQKKAPGENSRVIAIVIVGVVILAIFGFILIIS